MELKPLPEGLKYAFLGEEQTYHVVISYILTSDQEGYYQIHIALEDQEKTTFTCPFGTFTFKRMAFGLCNAPKTFQKCKMHLQWNTQEKKKFFIEVKKFYWDDPYLFKYCPY